MSKDTRGIDLKSIGTSVIAFGSRNTDLAVRVAIFTAIAHCCLGLLFVAGFQVYMIFETFVRPLIWALLTGTFLFPFKSFLADMVKSWLNGLRTTSTPILVGVALTPLKLVDKGLDCVGAEIVEFFRKHGWKILYVGAAVVSYFVVYFYIAPYLGVFGTMIGYVLKATTALSTHVVWLIVLPYGFALHFFWKQGYRSHLLVAAVPLWILIGFYLYYLLDELAVPIYLFIALTIGLGYSDSSNITAPAPSSGLKASHHEISASKESAQVRHEKHIDSPASSISRFSVPRSVPLPVAASSGVTKSHSPLFLRESAHASKLEDRPRADSPFEREATVVTESATVQGEIAHETDGQKEKIESEAEIESSGQSMFSMFGDMRDLSRSVFKHTYQNVADVLKEDSLTSSKTDAAKADAEVLRNKLKELGMGGTADTSAGTRYLGYVFWAFFLLQALTTYYVVPLMLIPVAYRIIKLLARREGIFDKLRAYTVPIVNDVKHWTDDRSEVVAPSLLKNLITYAKIGDRKVLSMIEGVTDETVSAILICLMFFVAFVGGVIGMLQIENETTHMVRVSGAVFDDVFQNHPEFYEWLPEAEDFQAHFQTAMESAYVYGRDWAVKTVRSTIADTNETRVSEIEHDLTTIADRFYSYYIAQNATGKLELTETNVGLGSVLGIKLGDPLMWFASNNTNASIWDFDIWSSINTDAIAELSQYLNFGHIQAFVKTHIDTFVSVLESVWLILRSNVALILSLGTTIASVTLTYFSAFLNFILCAIIFLTALFYLLSSSGSRYKPIELIAALSQYYQGAETLANIVEDSVSGIFAVSFKIGTFYGFYTWVLLSFCGIYVRFIPSILAAILAVCPLVPTYVVCLPSALTLWIRSDYVTMIILCIGAYLPKLFVDAAIYGDMKTANPYIFGLSVAGGLVTLGIEGAVVGPLMLCFLFIVMECYKLAIQSRFMASDDCEQETVVSNGPTSVKHTTVRAL